MQPRFDSPLYRKRAGRGFAKRRHTAVLAGIFAGVSAGFLALSGCIPSSGVPAPAPAPAPAPRPVVQPQLPEQPLPPEPANWRHAPVVAGEWRFVPAATGTYVSFVTPQGTSLVTLRCVPAQGAVTLTLPGSQPQIRVLTDSQQRMLNATAANGAVTASLSPRDNLLDAMMFSRGRFALEATGQPILYLPAWPEIARVTEDCR